MQKIIIDTNIYYSLIGISVNPKIDKQIFSNFEKYITTATLMECIIKHRNNLNSLKRILEPLINKHYNLISIGYVPIETQKIFNIYDAEKIDDINDIINEILTSKMKKESEFMRWFFYGIMQMCFDILQVTEKYRFDDKAKMKNFTKKNYRLLNNNINFILEEFQITLKKGYILEDPQKHMNNQFYKMMCDVFYVYLKNFYQIKLNNKKISPTKLDGKVSENITNDKFYKKTINNSFNTMT